MTEPDNQQLRRELDEMEKNTLAVIYAHTGTRAHADVPPGVFTQDALCT